MELEFFSRFIAALFAMINPLAAMPVFLSLTAGNTPQAQRKMAIQAAIATVIACFAIAIAGKFVLGLFGIAIDSFRIAGGILLFTIALTMISGSRHTSSSGTEKERASQENIDNPAIYPFTIPMTVGPGTITTLIIFSEQASTSPVKMGMFAAVVLIVVGLLLAALLVAPFLDRMVSHSARTVSIRIMGIILAALAVEFVITGLRGSGLIALNGM